MNRSSYIKGWRLYPWCMIGHHLQGFFCSLLLFTNFPPIMVGATLWVILYIAYQALSVLRKEDSPGLDIADFMIGFVFGLLLELILWF